MSSVLGALSSAAAALEAQRRGLDVAGQNIANVNTAGYSRRTLELRERTPAGPGDAGGGVTIGQVRAVRDVFLETRIRQEEQGRSRDAVVADSLSVVEAQLGQPGASLDGQLSAFFDAFSSLAEDPSSLTLRDAVSREADRLGAAFREMSSRLEETRRNTDVGVRTAVDEINALARSIAGLNARIQSAGGADTDALVDERNESLKELSKLTDLTVSESDGVLTVALPGGHVLLSGNFVTGLSVADEAGTGLARVLNGDQDITSSITNGALGGQLYARDSLIPGYADSVDRLAFAVANEVNAAHAAGVDSLGHPAGPLFDVSAVEAGAASTMRISAAIAADARLIAAGGASANDVARGIAALRDATIVGGATPSAAWGQLLYRVGADSADAQRSQHGRDQVMTQLERLRDATSGVSLDEEAASLMRYQRAYEANARYFQLINSVLDTLMEAVR
jgi:flagellar hook-associated protein 1 FlgK